MSRESPDGRLSVSCDLGEHHLCPTSSCRCDCHQTEELVADFTVRLYRTGQHRARVEVVGNRTGTTGSAPCGVGLEWIYALLRALGQAGAYGDSDPFTRSAR